MRFKPDIVMEFALLLLPILYHTKHWEDLVLSTAVLICLQTLEGDVYQWVLAALVQPITNRNLLPLSMCSVYLHNAQSSWLRHLLFDVVFTCWVEPEAWLLARVYRDINEVIECTVQKSLTSTERGFAAMGLSWLFMEGAADFHWNQLTFALESLRSRQVLFLLVCIPLISLSPLIPIFREIVRYSSIVGKHKRPKDWDNKKLRYAISIYIAYPIIVLGVLNFLIGPSSLFSLLQTLIAENILMLGFWLTVVLVTILCVLVGSRLQIFQNFPQPILLDLKRKLWHFLIILMFSPFTSAPGAAAWFAIAIVVFLLLELIRATTMPPFASHLHQFLSGFIDHRDTQGPMIVSHLFLLLGVGIPVMINFSPAGIIMLGFGDSSASIVGRSIGRHKILGTSKTLEGSIAFVIASSLGFYIFTSIPLRIIPFISVLCALLEACTRVNDNIMLPIYALALSANFQ